MSAWMRWRIALPLLGLSLLLFIPAVFGAWAWWSEFGTAYRTITVLICLMLATCVGASLSIGIKKREGVPWIHIGVVALGILAACGLTAVR